MRKTWHGNRLAPNCTIRDSNCHELQVRQPAQATQEFIDFPLKLPCIIVCFFQKHPHCFRPMVAKAKALLAPFHYFPDPTLPPEPSFSFLFLIHSALCIVKSGISLACSFWRLLMPLPEIHTEHPPGTTAKRAAFTGQGRRNSSITELLGITAKAFPFDLL